MLQEFSVKFNKKRNVLVQKLKLEQLGRIDVESFKKQIEDLQTENKSKDEQHQTELKDLKLTNAIKSAILGKAQDEDLVAGLLDKSKLILGEDGKITGLDEQLTSLQESKKFLFKQEEQQQQAGFVPIGANQQQQQQTTVDNALASAFGNAK